MLEVELGVVLCVLCFLMLQTRSSQKSGFNGRKFRPIPGPTPLPLVGNLINLGLAAKKKPIHEVLTDYNLKYGPIVRLDLGLLNSISSVTVISDLSLMKKLLFSDDWSMRFTDAHVQERSFHKPLGVLFGTGESWQEIRRFTEKTLRNFGFGKHLRMQSTMADEICDLEEDLNKLIEDNDSVVCLKTFFNASVLNVLWSMMAGTRLAHTDPKLQKLVSLTADIVRANPVVNAKAALPSLRFLMPSFWNLRRMYKELHEVTQQVMDERRAAGHHYREECNDCIDVFLKEIEAHEQNPNTIYTQEQFQTVMVDLIQAGSETSSSALEFSILCMVLHPEVQSRIQDEISTVTGNARKPVFADQLSMPYTEAALLEIMRLANPTGVFFRTSVRDTEVDGYFFQKGSVAMLNIYAMHLNETDWPDAMLFKPERFLDPEGQVIRNNRTLPFGAGKRVCLGEQMSKVTMFTFLTTLLQSYTFMPCDSRPPNDCWMQLLEGFTLAPKTFYTKVVRRN